MKTKTSIESLEAIETSIRRRLKDLDENYKKERDMLELELKQFVVTKRLISEFLNKYQEMLLIPLHNNIGNNIG